MLVTLLVLEGLAALLVTLLNLVTSNALGQDFLAWESYLIPGVFGALCLVAAFGVMRSMTWGRALAAIAQLLVLAGGDRAPVERPARPPGGRSASDSGVCCSSNEPPGRPGTRFGKHDS